jgi:catechol 2,3-dioxygenase-like lactoylglutathione lyase family enzyme
MEPRISFITLGVSDLERSIRFYEQVLELPRLESPPGVAFFELGMTWLSLFPWDDLAADAGVSAQGSGFRGFSLAHNLRSPEEVDRLMRHIAAHGGQVVKQPQRAEWGGYTGYFADPDGFLWELAWNPGFPHV